MADQPPIINEAIAQKKFSWPAVGRNGQRNVCQGNNFKPPACRHSSDNHSPNDVPAFFFE
jgi:hypothetical protein